jgi:small nuclear ribonucleoprotein (snRNP)-like protein
VCVITVGAIGEEWARGYKTVVSGWRKANKQPPRYALSDGRSIEMSLKEVLAANRDRQMIVIMKDGRGFRGRPVRFDDDVIVLKEVFETLNQDVDEKGYMFWRRVLHSFLIINADHVTRIWPWEVAT